MSLPRCTEGRRNDAPRFRAAPFVLWLLAIAGCATAPSPPQPGADAAGMEGEAAVAREIPPHARTLYEQAVAAMAAGDSLDAELRFKEFLLSYPDYPGAHVNLAIIHAANGDDAAAEGSLTDALILDPGHPVALNQLGMLLRRQGKFAEAEAAYLKALTIQPDYALAHYNLGVLYELYLQHLDIALHHFERYQELTGDDEQVEKWIVDLRRRLGANQRTANVTE